VTQAAPYSQSFGANRPGPRWLRVFMRFCRTQPLGALALLLILTMLGAAFFGPQFAPHDPLATRFDAVLQAPNAQHWMGTDSYGRDVFSRIVHGTRSALLLGISTAFIGALVGGGLGAASAYFGGRVDAA
jgi:peptide/nickel transport system permease protein